MNMTYQQQALLVAIFGWQLMLFPLCGWIALIILAVGVYRGY
jgi:hypothetical protein